MRVYAPVKDFNGVRNGVRFVDGVGETDNLRLIEWFESHGYRVPVEDSFDSLEKCEDLSQNSLEECEQVVEINEPVNETPKMPKVPKTPKIAVEDLPDLEAMNPFELREWAVINGFGTQIRNTRSKEKLIKIIRG